MKRHVVLVLGLILGSTGWTQNNDNINQLSIYDSIDFIAETNPSVPIFLENARVTPTSEEVYHVLKVTDGALWVGNPENQAGAKLSYGYPGSVNAEYGLFSKDLHAQETVYGAEGVVVGKGRQDHWHDGSLIISSQGQAVGGGPGEGEPLAGTQVSRMYTDNKGLHFENDHIYPNGSISRVFDFDSPVHVQSNIMSSGTVTASLFSGSGASLTSLPAGNLTGSIADARLSGNVVLENVANTFTGTQTMPMLNLTNTIRQIHFDTGVTVADQDFQRSTTINADRTFRWGRETNTGTGSLESVWFKGDGTGYESMRLDHKTAQLIVGGSNPSHFPNIIAENRGGTHRGEIAVKGAGGGGITFWEGYNSGNIKWFFGGSTNLIYYNYDAPAGNVFALSGGANKGSDFFATGTGIHNFYHSGTSRFYVHSTGSISSGLLTARNNVAGWQQVIRMENTATGGNAAAVINADSQTQWVYARGGVNKWNLTNNTVDEFLISSYTAGELLSFSLTGGVGFFGVTPVARFEDTVDDVYSSTNAFTSHDAAAMKEAYERIEQLEALVMSYGLMLGL